MRLEKIVLDGFKSFADKTEFVFSNQITAIVGPNGCGKSNVVDALKWVLGEQSTKSLRSGQMLDVIFSGSSNRKPTGRAEVSLFFSQASSLGLEHDELQITRRLYRSGESEYLINNKSSRLKDIRELFMDTGVGLKAYSIIEQGQISQLLTASKVDRRAIFEEAAGISKYKSQKKEAIRKLERAEQNILRLADIVGEVQKQLRSVKLQAGKARNYLQYSQRLKELRVNYSLAQYHELLIESKDKNALLSGQQDLFAKAAAEVSENDSRFSKLSTEITDKEGEINRCDNLLVSVTSKVEQFQQRVEFLNNRIEDLQGRSRSEAEQIEAVKSRSVVFEQELASVTVELKQISSNLEVKSAELDRLEKDIHEINFSCSGLETELQDEKSGIIDIVRKTAQLHNEIQSISVYRDNLNGQKDRLTGRVGQSREQLEKLLGQKAQSRARLDDINKVIAELQKNLEEKRNQIKEIDSDVARVNEDLAKRREARSAVQSEINVLSEMEDKREGINKSVKEILKLAKEGGKDYIQGILADRIEAEAAYAKAIESALAERADSVIVADSERLLCDGDVLGQDFGRVKFLCSDRVAPFSDKSDFSRFDGVLGRAIEFVRYSGRDSALLWSILGRVIIVDSLETAIKLRGVCSSGQSFVTVSGESLYSDGTISTGTFAQGMGLISRKSRLVELSGELSEISVQIELLEDKLASDVQQNAHLEKLCKDFRTSVYEANTEKTNMASELGLVEQNIKRLTEEQPILAGEIELLDKQISDTVQKEYDSKQKLDELETVNAQRNSRIEQLEEELAEKKLIQDAKAGELMELKVSLGQANEQKRSYMQTISSLESQIEHNRAALEFAKSNIDSYVEQVAESKKNITQTEAEIAEMLEQKENAQADSVRLHGEVEEMIAERKNTEELLRAKRALQKELDEKIHELRVAVSQLEVRSAELSQRVAEELSMDLAEAYENYSAEEIDWAAVKEEIDTLRSKIERLGNVNVDAIEQMEELEERNEFLTSQIEDLNKSKAQLQQLISKLNRESVEKFTKTFEEVRKNFQVVFRKLFGGGKADIILDEPDDILESGIEIVARPPGKETRSISLLSGGEKTMTAIALLFSIFQTKPSPFCFLDEVDAALDEANNERFNLIVQDFKANSQFIIITHAKRTMSIADVLFGVTMQQKGVSKKISVRFDTYESPAVA